MYVYIPSHEPYPATGESGTSMSEEETMMWDMIGRDREGRITENGRFLECAAQRTNEAEIPGTDADDNLRPSAPPPMPFA